MSFIEPQDFVVKTVSSLTFCKSVDFGYISLLTLEDDGSNTNTFIYFTLW